MTDRQTDGQTDLRHPRSRLHMRRAVKIKQQNTVLLIAHAGNIFRPTAGPQANVNKRPDGDDDDDADWLLMVVDVCRLINHGREDESSEMSINANVHLVLYFINHYLTTLILHRNTPTCTC